MVELIREFDFASMILLILIVGIFLAMIAIQKRSDFDWGEGFRDPVTKMVNYPRAVVPAAFVFTTWFVYYILIEGMRTSFSADDLVKVLNAVFPFVVLHCLVWAGTDSVNKLIEVARDWVNKNRPIQPNQPPATATQTDVRVTTGVPTP